MLKDVSMYLELLAGLGVAEPQRVRSRGIASGSPANWATPIGSAIRVVDAIGDVSGGVRLHDSTEGTR